MRFSRRVSATVRSGLADVPAFCRDLVPGEVVLRLRAANPRPAFPRRVDDVQVVGDLRHEVVDVGVPVAVEGRGEEQLRVVVQEHEAHVVEGADLVRAVEVAVQQLQERAQPLGSAGRERDDDGQLRDLAQAAADPAGALHRRRRLRHLRRQLSEHALQRLLPHLRRVGEQLPQLLDLLLGGLVLVPARSLSRCCVAMTVSAPSRSCRPTGYGSTESALVGSVCGWWLSVRRTLADAL